MQVMTLCITHQALQSHTLVGVDTCSCSLVQQATCAVLLKADTILTRYSLLPQIPPQIPTRQENLGLILVPGSTSAVCTHLCTHFKTSSALLATNQLTTAEEHLPIALQHSYARHTMVHQPSTQAS
jgi:hypothetical protein